MEQKKDGIEKSAEKELYCVAVDQIKAPEYLRERVKNLEPRRVRRRSVRRLVYAAAAVAVAFVSGNVVSYAATGNSLVENLKRSVSFYPSQEEADAARRTYEGPQHNISEILTEDPWTESRNLTVEEVYDICFHVYDEDEVISDETGSAEDVWTRRLIQADGDEVRESYSADDAAKLTTLCEPISGWELSWLGEHYTPRAKGQIMIQCKKKSDGSLTHLILDAFYGEEDGENFSLWATGQPGQEYGRDFVNEQKLDEYEYYTTIDGVEVSIMKKGDEILADHTGEDFECMVHAEHMSVDRVKELVDHLNLAQFVRGMNGI